MKNGIKEPTVKRRKNLLTSKVVDIPYHDLYLLYENECRLKNLSETTIRGYFFADKYFTQFAGENLMGEPDCTKHRRTLKQHVPILHRFES